VCSQRSGSSSGIGGRTTPDAAAGLADRWLMRRLAGLARRARLSKPWEKFAKAIRYTLGHWDSLTLFLSDGRVEVGSNTSGRCVRSPSARRSISSPGRNFLRGYRVLKPRKTAGASHQRLASRLVEHARQTCGRQGKSTVRGDDRASDSADQCQAFCHRYELTAAHEFL
jgi:hypothetical protein